MGHYSPEGPIGIFDSGLGGLSVLRHIRETLPSEHLHYFADSGFAPYGDRSEEEIIERSLVIAHFLLRQNCKALVVACNTATSTAITAIRSAYPTLNVVGVEPGIKPAAAISMTRIVGVLATQRTVSSARFAQLQQQIAETSGVKFIAQGCPLLADQVEKGELASPTTIALVAKYVAPMLKQGADTLVLGCTHYPFLSETIKNICIQLNHPDTTLIDTGVPVARQLARLIDTNQLHREAARGDITAYTTANESTLRSAMQRLLEIEAPVFKINSN